MTDLVYSQSNYPQYAVSVSTPQPSFVPQRGGLWEWYQQFKTPVPSVPPTPVQSAMSTVRDYGVGGISAALLALIETDLGGLDFKGKYPIDGIAALVMAGLSIRDRAHPDGLGAAFAASGQSCNDVFWFRKLVAYRQAQKSKGTVTSINGESDNSNVVHSDESDPLLSAAKKAGLYKKAA